MRTPRTDYLNYAEFQTGIYLVLLPANSVCHSDHHRILLHNPDPFQICVGEELIKDCRIIQRTTSTRSRRSILPPHKFMSDIALQRFLLSQDVICTHMVS